VRCLKLLGHTSIQFDRIRCYLLPPRVVHSISPPFWQKKYNLFSSLPTSLTPQMKLKRASPTCVLIRLLQRRLNNQIRCSITVSILGFHPRDPGSIPGSGTLIFFLKEQENDNCANFCCCCCCSFYFFCCELHTSIDWDSF
jgi:hypothetical protein